MTQPQTEDLLKKINYIEADIEIQKQILFSIPSDQKGEMEKTIAIIAAKKNEIGALRQELLRHDPDEHNRIVVFEEAVAKFKKIAAENPFQAIINRNVNEELSLALKDGEAPQCLIKACDKKGDWTIITLEGEIKQFSAEEVTEQPPTQEI